jgi:hypothetical protein
MLVLGIAAIHTMSVPAKSSVFCPSLPRLCSEQTTAGHCGNGRTEDCHACYGVNGIVVNNAPDCATH